MEKKEKLSKFPPKNLFNNNIYIFPTLNLITPYFILLLHKKKRSHNIVLQYGNPSQYLIPVIFINTNFSILQNFFSRVSCNTPRDKVMKCLRMGTFQKSFHMFHNFNYLLIGKCFKKIMMITCMENTGILSRVTYIIIHDNYDLFGIIDFSLTTVNKFIIPVKISLAVHINKQIRSWCCYWLLIMMDEWTLKINITQP